MKPCEKQISNWFLQLCEAVLFLHGKNIIHRDIKPSNILLGEDGKIRLIDFDAAREEKTCVQNDTIILGTKGYAPPEQYGFAQTDVRTDIYALGVTFKKLLGEKSNNKIYRDIIKKCTELDPKNRFKSVKTLEIAWKFKVAKQFVLPICIMIILSVSALIYNYILDSSSAPVSSEFTLTEEITTETTVAFSSEITTNTSAEKIISNAQTTTEIKEDNSDENLLFHTTNNNSDYIISNAQTTTEIKENNSDENLLFYTTNNNSNYIISSVYDLKNNDEKIEMEVDLNEDGFNEKIQLFADKNDDIRLSITSGEFPELDKIYYLFTLDLRDEDFIQITCLDLDDVYTSISEKEIVISVGDKKTAMFSDVLIYSENSENISVKDIVNLVWGGQYLRENEKKITSVIVADSKEYHNKMVFSCAFGFAWEDANDVEITLDEYLEILGEKSPFELWLGQ